MMVYQVHTEDGTKCYDYMKLLPHGWVELYDDDGKSDYFPRESIKYISQVRSE